jgi:hypothetical protein
MPGFDGPLHQRETRDLVCGCSWTYQKLMLNWGRNEDIGEVERVYSKEWKWTRTEALMLANLIHCCWAVMLWVGEVPRNKTSGHPDWRKV